MLVIHPSILVKDGKKEFAVLPFNEFLQIQEELQAYEDLKQLREAKAREADAKGIPLDEAKKQLGL